MTPKEKAKELFNKYLEYTKEWNEIDGYVNNEYDAKQCALIAVDEIMIYLDAIMLPNPFKQYWNKVKNEIEKL
jgi:hypothetical protein